MTKYREIKGTLIQNVSADPPASFEGQVWYNTTSNALKIDKGALVSAWATGGNLNTARGRFGGAGTQTAGLVFGGAPPPVTVLTESYDGTSWTEVNDLNQFRQGFGSAGASNTSALAFGGLAFPGGPPNGQVNQTETWNGTNWTEVNDLNAGRRDVKGFGIQTSALAFGGFQDTGGPEPSEYFALTESWNGTNWTEVNDLNLGRSYLAGAGDSNTAGLAFGGYVAPGPTGKAETELWNGTNWTEVNNLNQSRYGLAGTGTSTAALGFGRWPLPPGSMTEEFTVTGGIETITSS